jgi:hypothetical protein
VGYRSMTTSERWIARLIVGTAGVCSLLVAIYVSLKDILQA